MNRRFAVVSTLGLLGLAASGLAESQTVTSRDGTRIAYRVQGQGQPALVFVHGWSCDSGYWDAQVAHFAPCHRVLAVDLAGHGASGAGRSEWTIAHFAEDVAAVAAQEKLDRVVLIGHSMGGPVCLEAARVLGDRALAVVGVDTFHDLDRLPSAEEFRQFVAPFERDFPMATAAFVRSMFTETADPALVDRIAKDMASAPPQVALASFGALFSYRAQDTLPKLHIPVFAINADKYPVKTEAVTRHGLAFDVKLMKGRGHFVAQEDPALFNRLLDEVLAGLASTPAAQAKGQGNGG